MDPGRTFDEESQPSPAAPTAESSSHTDAHEDEYTVEQQITDWYEEHTPNRENFDFDIFEHGLLANEKQMTALEDICVRKCIQFDLGNVSIGLMGLDKVGSLVDQAAEAIMDEVTQVFPLVPHEWLRAWITAYVDRVAQETPDSHIQDPENAIVTSPRNSTSTKGGKIEKIQGISISAIDGDWPRPGPGEVPLWETIFVLEIHRAEFGRLHRAEQIPSSRCVSIGHFGGHAHEYLFELFLDEFQTIIDNSDQPWDLRKGELVWPNNGNKTPIRTQQDFEVAILHMFRNRGEGYNLKFSVYPAEDSINEAANAEQRSSQLEAPLLPLPFEFKTSSTLTAPRRPSSFSRNLPLRLSDADHHEKISRIRNIFTPQARPSEGAVEEALIASGGAVNGALAILGGEFIPSIRDSTMKRKPVAGSEAAAQVVASAPVQHTENPAPVAQRLPAAPSSAIPVDSQEGQSNPILDISRIPDTRSRTASLIPVFSTDNRGSVSDVIRSRQSSSDGRGRNSDVSGFQRSSGDRGRSSGDDNGTGWRSTSKARRSRSSSAESLAVGTMNINSGVLATLKRVVSGPPKDGYPENADPTVFTESFQETSRAIYVSGGEYGTLAGCQLSPTNESEDREIDERNDPTGRLKDLLNESVLNQMGKPSFEINGRKIDWYTCCQMFRIDHTKTELSERVHVVGLKRGLFQFQAYGVYWQMVASRNGGGGIIADSPGLGKTLSYLAMLVVERQLSILWTEVEESRRARNRLHLPVAGQNRFSICPSSREGWICCPCVEAGPTSRLQPKMGVRLALVPGPLIANWRNQWDQHIDTTNRKLDMKLFIAQVGAAGLATDMADYPANLNMLKAKPQIRIADSPKSGQERFLVLTTLQSLPVFLNNIKYNGEALLPAGRIDSYGIPARYAYVLGATRYQIAFGIVCADECHEPCPTKSRAEVIGELPGNPWCWGLSGTPFDLSPRYMQHMVASIEMQQERLQVTEPASRWADGHLIYQNFTREKVENLCRDYMLHLAPEKRKKPEKSMDQIISEMRTLLSALMIRRTPDTLWFCHELVELKPSVHQDIVLQRDNKYAERIQFFMPRIIEDVEEKLRALQEQWDQLPPHDRTGPRPEVLGFNNNIYAKYRLRIFETCPGLIDLTANGALTLKNEDLTQWRHQSKEKKSPYYKNTRRLLESSPKLQWLVDQLKKLSLLSTSDGKEVKIIILTNFNVIALICKHVIERFFPEKKGRVGLVHDQLTPRGRDDLIEAFCDEMRTMDRAGTVRRKNEDENYQYLIGTMKQIGKGYQLTRASYVILMEPDLDFGKEVQALRRINRIGQKEPCTWTMKLTVDQNELEALIMNRQSDQGKAHGTLIQPVDLPLFLDSTGYKKLLLPPPTEPAPFFPPRPQRTSLPPSSGVSRTQRSNRPRENPLTKSEVGTPTRPPITGGRDTRQAASRSGPSAPARSRDSSPSTAPPRRPSPSTASASPRRTVRGPSISSAESSPLRRPATARSTRDPIPLTASGSPRRPVGAPSRQVSQGTYSRDQSPSTNSTPPRRPAARSTSSRDPSPGNQSRPLPRTNTNRSKPPDSGRRDVSSQERDPLGGRRLRRKNGSGELRADSEKSGNESSGAEGRF